jgi:diguanylate cyclase (GGDEF)-like protein
MAYQDVKQHGEHEEPLMAERGPRRLEMRNVYILDASGETSEELVHSLGYYHITPTVFTDKESLADAVDRTEPACIILGDALGMSDMREQVEAINDHRQKRIPIVVVHPDDKPETRLLAARLKTDGFFSSPVDVGRLVDAIDKLVTVRNSGNPHRVMIVDDDVEQSKEHANVLRRAGMDVYIIDHPTKVFAAINDFDPDLVMVERETPDYSGIEVAGMLRQHATYSWIPVIIVANYIDAELRIEAIRHGSVDILPKPVAPKLLSSAVANEIERSKLMKSMMLSDSLTGLLNHTTIKRLLESEIARTTRAGEPISFVMIDIDNFKRINDSYGHPTGDRVIKALATLLKQSMRKSDLIGRYGGEEFALILPNTPAEGALILINRIRENFAKIVHQSSDLVNFTATFSAGICEHRHGYVQRQARRQKPRAHFRQAITPAAMPARHARAGTSSCCFVVA